MTPLYAEDGIKLLQNERLVIIEFRSRVRMFALDKNEAVDVAVHWMIETGIIRRGESWRAQSFDRTHSVMGVA